MKEARFGKEHVIWKLRNVLRGHAMIITESNYLSDEDRKEQMATIEELAAKVAELEQHENMAVLKQSNKNKTQEEMDKVEKEDMGYEGGR